MPLTNDLPAPTPLAELSDPFDAKVQEDYLALRSLRRVEIVVLAECEQTEHG